MVTITTNLASSLSFTASVNSGYFPVTIAATVTETNPALTMVGATLDWNDGTPAVNFGPSKPLSINTTRNLYVGTYYLTLTAFNYLRPTPQTVRQYFSVEVMPASTVPVPNDFLFGPILPLDDGFPNAAEWNFNTSTNLDVLKSSVKMLLLTTKGERIMQPTYGTYLRRAVFDLSTDSIGGIIQKEIDEALNQFEPRVRLDSFTIQRQPNQRSVIVLADFVSKLNQSTFQIALPLS